MASQRERPNTRNKEEILRHWQFSLGASEPRALSLLGKNRETGAMSDMKDNMGWDWVGGSYFSSFKVYSL